MTNARPLSYDPAVEHAESDEAHAVASINTSMRGILETTWQDYGHSVRSAYAKSHGLLEGELQVLDGLPKHLAQGVFSHPATYPVVLRISTNPGDILDDTVAASRGLAMKIIGVDGERLPGSEGDATQDFIMVNGPAFVAPNAQGFDRSLKLLAATTDTGQAWKKAFSAVLRGAATALTAAGSESGSLKTLGGQPLTHPLGETFYTQTPFRYGEHIAKLSVAPVSPELTALKDAPVDLAGKPNGLRAAVIDFCPHTPDARPGTLGQPLNATARKVAAGAIGGLAAGALLSVIFLGMEAATAEPSDLIKLKRRTAARAGWRGKRDRAEPDSGEQVVSHGGHLALSIAAGAVYGAAKPDAMPAVVAGAALGAGFYALAYGVVGPTLQVTPRLSKDTPSSIVQHGLFHVLFGVATALVVDGVARRI